MIEELKILLTEFPGPASHTRCFAHIINLISKTVICQFDVPTAEDKEIANEVLKELRMLAGDIEAEELITRTSRSDATDTDDSDDKAEDWVDEREDMDWGELEELDVDVQLVQMVLVKVSNSSGVSSAGTTSCNFMLTNNGYASSASYPLQ
jgi:hypothetical protein